MIHKNNSRWIREFNVRAPTIKLLEETSYKYSSPVIWQQILRCDTKNISKASKLSFIKLKNLDTSKSTIKEIKKSNLCVLVTFLVAVAKYVKRIL